jgi:hypothetical protein
MDSFGGISKVVPMLDWNSFETRLYDAAVDAINRFADDHPGDPICFFAFDSEPKYGYVMFALDTLQNNIGSAQQREPYTIKSRNNWLTDKRYWKQAKYYLCHPSVSVFNTNSGDFAYSQYAEVKFPEWESVARSGDYPKGEEHDDDYLDSNARILFWNVVQRLVSDNAFAKLNMARPFMVGYGIHDEEEQILRVLNWPSSAS